MSLDNRHPGSEAFRELEKEAATRAVRSVFAEQGFKKLNDNHFEFKRGVIKFSTTNDTIYYLVRREPWILSTRTISFGGHVQKEEAGTWDKAAEIIAGKIKKRL